MTPDEQIKAHQAITIMLSSFPQQSGTEHEMVQVNFLECVDPYSAEAVEEACLRYRRGEVVEHDARFAPSTAQFTQAVKERQAYIDLRNRPRIQPSHQIEKQKSPPVSGKKMQALSDVLHGKRSWRSLAEEFGTKIDTE